MHYVIDRYYSLFAFKIKQICFAMNLNSENFFLKEFIADIMTPAASLKLSHNQSRSLFELNSLQIMQNKTEMA